MRKTGFTFLPAVLLACATEPTAPSVITASAPPASVATSDWITYDYGPFVFPMYLDCLDETVDWLGYARFRDHVVSFSGGGSHLNEKGWVIEGGTLVGPTSGTWDHVRTTSNAEIVGLYNFHVNEKITWQNAGTGQIMYVWIRIHYLIGGDGEVKLNINPEGEHTCTLQH